LCFVVRAFCEFFLGKCFFLWGGRKRKSLPSFLSRSRNDHSFERTVVPHKTYIMFSRFATLARAARSAATSAASAARPATDALPSQVHSAKGFAAMGVTSTALLGLAGVAYADEAEHGLASAQYPWPHEGMFDSYDHTSIRRGRGGGGLYKQETRLVPEMGAPQRENAPVVTHPSIPSSPPTLAS
jgi:hypothetical protein